ncbi:unnamed protein product [Orchesella dallaii]|uniref:NADPH oxidase 5 n=1 Tax=Orchesella dallaii TaxID=48710 RepID=A0ABP1RLN8_9HEXA
MTQLLPTYTNYSTCKYPDNYSVVELLGFQKAIKEDKSKKLGSSRQKLKFLQELDLVLANKPKVTPICEENGSTHPKPDDAQLANEIDRVFINPTSNGNSNCVPNHLQPKSVNFHEPNKDYVVLNSCGSTSDLISMWQNKVRFETPPKNGVKLRNKRRSTLRGLSRTFRQQFQHKTLYHLEGMEKEEVLQILFHLFYRKQQRSLNQYQWIEFLKVRLIGSGSERDENWVEFMELLECVTYSVCGEDNIDFEKFRLIFEEKGILTKWFRLIDNDASGVITAEKIMGFISHLMSSPWSNSRLNKDTVVSLEKLFRKVVPNGDFISREDFKQIIPTKNEFFFDRVFDIFNESGSGFISLAEFLSAMHQFASGQDPDAKIRFLFKVYDADKDGKIGVQELGTVIKACMEENGMKFSEAQTDELTQALFDDADVEGSGSLTFSELKAQLEKHHGLSENMSIMLDQWLVPPEKPKQNVHLQRSNKFSTKYLKNNYVYLIWYHLFLIANITLFSSRFFCYQKENPCATIYLILAKSSGQCLNFNCTFLVILMLRQCLTFLRSRGASAFLPIDQHIKFHKLTGIFTFVFGVFHTVMHLINIAEGILPSIGILGGRSILNITSVTGCPLNSGNWTYFEFLLDPRTTSQARIFRVVLMAILTIMMVGSLPCVRRGGGFQIFYWTHLLYYPFWILLVIHAPSFWKWFIIPGLIFFIEQTFRCYNSKVGKGHTWVSSGILLPSNVTHVAIKRPSNFDFRPSDYVFVRIPRIAKYEWHPFTISSAPEQLDEIWLHVRACGQWTTKLYEYFEKEQTKVNFDLETIKIDSQRNEDLTPTHVAISSKLDLEKIPQKLPILMKPRSKLKASQSLSPHAEIKRDSCTEPRSISVYEQGSPKETENSRARRTTAKSFKYARNKPKVIALKVPLSNENEGVAMDRYSI